MAVDVGRRKRVSSLRVCRRVGWMCPASWMQVKALPVFAGFLLLWFTLPTTASAYWQPLRLEVRTGSGGAAYIHDNDPLDLDPALDSIRIGGTQGSPLVVGGFEVSAQGRSYRRDGVQYVTLTDVLLSGGGSSEISLQLFRGYELPAEMFGYASHWSQARFVEPMQPDNHAQVYSFGGLFHNDIDTHFPYRAMGTIDGIPGAESIVFNPVADPDDDFAYWFLRSYFTGIPEYSIWTEMHFSDLRTDLPNHIRFESEMKVTFAPWVPEPTSSVIWSAFGLAGLSLRGKRNSLRSVPAL